MRKMKFVFTFLMIFLLCNEVRCRRRYRFGNNFENQNRVVDSNSRISSRNDDRIVTTAVGTTESDSRVSNQRGMTGEEKITREEENSALKKPASRGLPRNEPPMEIQNERKTVSVGNIGETNSGNLPFGIPEAINHFSLRLYQTLIKSSGNENMCYSPIGITYAFSMLMLGAHQQSETEVFNGLELSKIFKTPDEAHSAFKTYLKMVGNHDYSLDFVNLFLIQRDLKINQDYIDKLDKHYNVTFAKVDFSSNQKLLMDFLNKWIQNITKGKVEHLLNQPLDTATKIAIFNIVYFKGYWLNGFDKNATHKGLFYKTRDKSFSVNFMVTLNEFPYYYNTEKGYRLIQLPYRGDVTFNVLLPKKKHSLDQVISKLNIADLTPPFEKSKIELFLPKFKIEKDYDLKKILPQLGINSIFNNKADLSGINEDQNLKVSSGKHKSVIEVNEEGTEASATTSIFASSRAARANLVFNANHPFLFYIRNQKSGIVYFMGRYGDPESISN